MGEILKPYNRDSPYSYAAGGYASLELIKARPELVSAVYVHPDFVDTSGLERLCSLEGIDVRHDAKAFERVNRKENTYALAVFRKPDSPISAKRPHIVLVNPGDMGNLGTITRVAAGLGLGDIAIITPAADVWNPKTIRASMGAVFRVNVSHFASVNDYVRAHPNHSLYPFMLDGAELNAQTLSPPSLYSLVFGNESTGLDKSFHSLGTSVRIPQSDEVDSLNLAIAVGIGTFVFTRISRDSASRP